MKKNIYKEIIDQAFSEHIEALEKTHITISQNIEIAADLIAKSLTSGGTIFWCGNGGSAADSQHIAAEFVGRFKKDRIKDRLIGHGPVPLGKGNADILKVFELLSKNDYQGIIIFQAFRDDEGVEIFKDQLNWFHGNVKL